MIELLSLVKKEIFVENYIYRLGNITNSVLVILFRMIDE